MLCYFPSFSFFANPKITLVIISTKSLSVSPNMSYQCVCVYYSSGTTRDLNQQNHGARWEDNSTSSKSIHEAKARGSNVECSKRWTLEEGEHSKEVNAWGEKPFKPLTCTLKTQNEWQDKPCSPLFVEKKSPFFDIKSFSTPSPSKMQKNRNFVVCTSYT